MFKKIKLSVAGILSVVLLAGAPALAAKPANPGNSNPHNKVTICHATGSSKNPFVQISVNANGSVSGHAGSKHQNGRDIIPPFDYNDNGTVKTFPGQNWNAQGQATFNNDCKVSGRGGGGGGTTTNGQNISGGQVSNQAASAGVGAATTGGVGAGATGAQVVPQGGVAAGDGGGKVTSAVSVLGLLGSLGTLATGVAFLRRVY
jgi:hypothetical protein